MILDNLLSYNQKILISILVGSLWYIAEHLIIILYYQEKVLFL